MARRAFNLPNMLTYGRILAVPLVVLCFFLEGRLKSSDFARWSALLIFVAASITDYFDGYFARELAALEEFADAGLLNIDDEWISVRPAGRMLIRAIAMVFDRYLRQDERARRYSRVV